MALAVFFRFYKLAEIPPGLYPDVAINGNNALTALKTGDFKVFYPENNGREGLFINLIALSFYFFGASVWAIKIVPAIIGVLTALGLYLMTKNLFAYTTCHSRAVSFHSFTRRRKSGNPESKHNIDSRRSLPRTTIRGGNDNRIGEIIALLSAFFLAVSFWHINFSRLGFRAIMVPFILVWGFYFLFKATRMTQALFPPSSAEEGPGEVLSGVPALAEDGSSTEVGTPFTQHPSLPSPQPRGGGNALLWLLAIGYWLLAGLTFGLGFHTYISYRVAPLIIGVFFIIEAYNFWQRKKPLTSNLLSLTSFIWPWLLFFAAVVFAVSPMLIYFYNNPQDFMGRTGQVSVFASATPIKDLTISAVKNLGMFNVWGDCNWRHNYACRPELPYAVGLLFLFGFFRCLGEILRKIYKRKTDIPSNSNDTNHKSWSLNQISFFLMVWFFTMLLPTALTNEGVPHALRAIGVIPAVYIFAGIGGWWVYKKFKIQNSKFKITFQNSKILKILIFVFIIWLIVYSYDLYFIQWGKNSEVKGAFTQNYVDIGNYLNTLPQETEKYVIVNEGGVPVPYPDGIPMPAQTIIFIQRAADKNKNTFYLKPDELPTLIGVLSPKPQKESVVVLMKYDKIILDELSEKIPQGEIKEIGGIWTLQIKI